MPYLSKIFLLLFGAVFSAVTAFGAALPISNLDISKEELIAQKFRPITTPNNGKEPQILSLDGAKRGRCNAGIYKVGDLVVKFEDDKFFQKNQMGWRSLNEKGLSLDQGFVVPQAAIKLKDCWAIVMPYAEGKLFNDCSIEEKQHFAFDIGKRLAQAASKGLKSTDWKIAEHLYDSQTQSVLLVDCGAFEMTPAPEEALWSNFRETLYRDLLTPWRTQFTSFENMYNKDMKPFPHSYRINKFIEGNVAPYFAQGFALTLGEKGGPLVCSWMLKKKLEQLEEEKKGILQGEYLGMKEEQKQIGLELIDRLQKVRSYEDVCKEVAHILEGLSPENLLPKPDNFYIQEIFLKALIFSPLKALISQ